MSEAENKLARIFLSVRDILEQNRAVLNQLDLENGDHGDHMVEIFDVAARAADERRGIPLAQAMEHVSHELSQRLENGSAQLYSSGLAQFALQFASRQVELEELLAYVQGLLQEKQEQKQAGPPRAGDVLKALVGGMSGWQQVEAGLAQPAGLDMGYLFDLGVIYMQSKQRGGTRLEVLADAAATASPLGKLPHRHASGKIALQALLEAMRDSF